MKPKPAPPKKRREISELLEAARDAIQRNDLPGGLGILDQAAAISTSDPESQSKVICLIGDAERRKGDFASAVGYYDRGGNLVASQRRSWMRPWFGRLIAALQQEDFDRAKTLAQEITSRAESEEKAFRSELKDFAKKLSKGEEFVVAKRPARISVVVSRLGQLFMNAGDLETAQRYFEKALEVNPVGGCRARLGLAEIAHKTGDFAKAAALSRDAIIRGKFQAKTLSGWPIHMDANVRQGKPPVDPELLDGLASAKATVRDRARLAIVARSRGLNAEGWPELAQTWAESAAEESPAIAVEIYKLISSTSTALPERAVRSAALALRDLPLAEQEWVSISRRESHVLASSGERVNYEDTLREGIRRFGTESTPRIARSVALIAAADGNKEYALAILDQALQASHQGSGEWARALWAKAKILIEDDRPAEAAECFKSYISYDAIPIRWRVFAISAWLASAPEGAVELTPSAWQLVDYVASSSTDYDLLLELGRRINGSTPAERSVSKNLLTAGADRAKEIILQSPIRSDSSRAFAKLTRTWTDKDRSADVVRLWESIPTTRKIFLASPDRSYFNALAAVIQSYCALNQLDDASTLTQQIGSDASTPWEAAAKLRITLALGFLRQSKVRNAFVIFNEFAQSKSSEEFVSYAFYWLGLRYIQDDYVADAHSAMHRVIEILGPDPRLSWKRTLVDIAKIVNGCANIAEINQLLARSAHTDAIIQFRGNLSLINKRDA